MQRTNPTAAHTHSFTFISITVCRAFVLAVSGAFSNRRWISCSSRNESRSQTNGSAPIETSLLEASLIHSITQCCFLTLPVHTFYHFSYHRKDCQKPIQQNPSPQLKRHSTNCTYDYPLTQNKLEMPAGSTKKLYHLPAKLM